MIAAARELKDRWLEQANSDLASRLPNGKYDATRVFAAPVNPTMLTVRPTLLTAA